MHLHEIIRKCRIRVPAMYGMYIDDTYQKKEELLKIHPKQFISGSVNLPLYKIRYSYNTARGNHREGDKYLCMNDCQTDYESAIMVESGPFQNWLSNHNRKNPRKAISNVKILEVTKEAEIIIDVAV